MKLKPHHPGLFTAAAQAEAWAGRFFKQQRVNSLLVMYGNVGCGKTHIAERLWQWAGRFAVMAWEIGGWKDVPTCHIVRWPLIVDAFKNGQYGAMETMRDEDMLVIDDVGADNDPSKNGMEKLCQILSARERKFTVVTTNIFPNYWEAVFENRVADRLLRNSVIVDMSKIPSFGTV